MDTITSSTQPRRNRLVQLGQDIWANVNTTIVKHRTVVDVVAKLASGFAQYKIWGSKGSLFEGGFNALQQIGDSSFHPRDFFSELNGWKQLSFETANISHLFVPLLDKFPAQSLKFPSYSATNVRLITLPLGKIGVSEWKDSWESVAYLFFKPSEMKESELQQLLIAEFLATFKTACFSVNDSGENSYTNAKFTLVGEDFSNAIHSKKTDEYLDYINTSLAKGINRSFLFYGLPGVGKTELSRSLFKALGFRTLKFRYSSAYNFNTFKFLIKAFKLEAIFIDDLDCIASSESLLEFLEYANKECKLVIGIANTLTEMHPALLRPGRFAMVIKIDALETETIKEIMGPLYKIYGARVKSWPVAYINELVSRKAIGKEEMTEVYEELNDRVKKQIKKVKTPS